MDAEREKDGGINEGMAILRLPTLSHELFMFLSKMNMEDKIDRDLFSMLLSRDLIVGLARNLLIF